MLRASALFAAALFAAAFLGACSGTAGPDLGPPIDRGPPPDRGPDFGPDAGPRPMIEVGWGFHRFHPIEEDTLVPIFVPDDPMGNGSFGHIPIAIRATVLPLRDVIFVDFECTRLRDGDAEACVNTRVRSVPREPDDDRFSLLLVDEELQIRAIEPVEDEELELRVELQDAETLETVTAVVTIPVGNEVVGVRPPDPT